MEKGEKLTMKMVRIPVEPQITEYLHVKASKTHTPITGTFELTPVCNMDCRMCYVRMSKQQQEAVQPLHTAEEWLALGEEAKKNGLLYLLLTGGEPFSRPDFRKILSGLHKLGFVISINSNGTLIDEEVVEWLKETPPTRINLTLYGASDETYAELCRNPKGFTQITKAIHLLKAVGISVKLNCSLTPYNAHDLEEIIAFAKREQLIVQATSYMFPPLRKDSSLIGQNDRFEPEEAAYYAARIESLLNGEDAYLERMNQQDFILPTDPDEECMDVEGESIRCRAGKCSFWVTWDGRFLPCGMLPTDNSPDVFEVGFAEAWKQASVFAASIRLPARCKSCDLFDSCKACAAMVLTESGNFHTVPEYRCRMAHEYPAACKRVKAEILKKRDKAKDDK